MVEMVLGLGRSQTPMSALVGIKQDPDKLELFPEQHDVIQGALVHSESLTWVTVGGTPGNAELHFDLLDYLPIYRTAVGAGGGWAFGSRR